MTIQRRLDKLERAVQPDRLVIADVAHFMQYVTLRDAGKWEGPAPTYTREIQDMIDETAALIARDATP